MTSLGDTSLIESTTQWGQSLTICSHHQASWFYCDRQWTNSSTKMLESSFDISLFSMRCWFCLFWPSFHEAHEQLVVNERRKDGDGQSLRSPIDLWHLAGNERSCFQWLLCWQHWKPLFPPLSSEPFLLVQKQEQRISCYTTTVFHFLLKSMS